MHLHIVEIVPEFKGAGMFFLIFPEFPMIRQRETHYVFSNFDLGQIRHRNTHVSSVSLHWTPLRKSLATGPKIGSITYVAKFTHKKLQNKKWRAFSVNW
jgi:hypothetical protein